jgi:hypothetical protein
MRRLGISCFLGVLALLLVAAPASAGRVWCARDPIVRIDGTDVQVWVAIPDEFVPYVTDAVRVKLATPKGLSHQVLFTDTGFNNYGEDVRWGDAPPTTNGTKPLGVEVRVDVDQGKIDKAFGKGTQVPVQVIVNVGTTTKTFDYATTKNTKFTVDINAMATATP